MAQLGEGLGIHADAVVGDVDDDKAAGIVFLEGGGEGDHLVLFFAFGKSVEDAVFQNGLQRKAKDPLIQCLGRGVPADAEHTAVAERFDLEIFLSDSQLAAEIDHIVVGVQVAAEDLRNQRDDFERGGIFRTFPQQGEAEHLEGVEQEVRVDLGLQCNGLCLFQFNELLGKFIFQTALLEGDVENMAVDLCNFVPVIFGGAVGGGFEKFENAENVVIPSNPPSRLTCGVLTL